MAEKKIKRLDKMDDQEEMKEALAELSSGNLKRIPMAARERGPTLQRLSLSDKKGGKNGRKEDKTIG